jgi:hypothetical protein
MKSMLLIAAGVAMAVICWGVYGPTLHEGQHHMGNSRLKPLICVGVAYFVVAIIVPLIVLVGQGELRGHWTFAGITWSLVAGGVGAIGAIGIILALSFGGRPVYVMPLVFGGAPVVNTLFTMYWTKAYREGVSPIFYAGLILVIVGAATVLVFAPRAPRVTGRAESQAGHAARAPWSDPSASDVS